MSTQPTNEPYTSLITTKLSAPVLRSQIVQRNRLIERLRIGMQRKLTILVAPAGYGKTTLLTEWIISLADIDWPIAWLSLDHEDNDIFIFWSYVIQSLQQVNPNFDLNPLEMQENTTGIAWHQQFVSLINQIASTQKHFSLVFDDYHVIDSASIHESVMYFISHMPENIHIVIASRVTPPVPLSKMRARNELLELKATELAFSLNESEILYKKILKLNLTPEEILNIYQISEGWIASLQLAALSIQEQSNVKKVISSLRLNNRNILDFLKEEILSFQTEEIQNFLIKSSIFEELSPNFCNYALEISNSRELIEHLEKSSLFIFPLDNNLQWYRFHTLITDLLSTILDNTFPNNEIIKIHLRACEWLKNNGFPEKAVPHALAGGNLELAADIVETCAMQAIIQFDFIDVIQWINRLPPEIILRRPSLGIYDALAHFNLARLNQVNSKITLVENAIQQKSDPYLNEKDKERIQIQVFSIQAVMDCLQGKLEQGISRALQMLNKIPEDDPYIYGWLWHNLAYAYISAGDLNSAAEAFKEGYRYAAKNNYPKAYVISRCELARIRKKQGNLIESEKEFRLALEEAIESDLDMDFIHLPKTGLGDIYREQNHLVQAREWMEAASDYFKITDIKNYNWVYPIVVYSRLAKYWTTLGNIEEADFFVQKSSRRLQYFQLFSDLTEDVIDSQVFLGLSKNDLSEIKQSIAASLEKNIKTDDLSQAEKIALIHVYISENQYTYAQNLIGVLEKEIRECGQSERLIETLILKTIVLKNLGESSKASTTLIEALSNAEPEGYFRIFLDRGELIGNLLLELQSDNLQRNTLTSKLNEYIKILLLEFGHTLQMQKFKALQATEKPKVISPLGEPLSNREMEVLILLMDNFSIKQIAKNLVISTNTVKVHIRNIYQKLDVHNREKAIEKAIEMNLLN